MTGTLGLAFLAGALSATSALTAQEWAQKMFPVRSHNFGTVARDAKTEFEFTFQNLYLKDVHVAGLRASCGCTSVWVKNDKRTLKSWETGAIVARFNTDRFTGSRGATITVTIDKPMWAEVQLQVNGFIRSDVSFDPGSVRLGSIDQGTKAEKLVTVNSPGSWTRVAKVESANPYLTAAVEPIAGYSGSYRLRVRLSESAPAGYVKEYLSVVTSDSQTRMPLLVEGYVAPRITLAPNTLYLGKVEPGQKVVKQLVVKGKEPFRITKISADGGEMAFPQGGDSVAKAVHVVPVTFVAGTEPGKVLRTIHIQTDMSGLTAELPAEAEVSESAHPAQKPETGASQSAGNMASTATR